MYPCSLASFRSSRIFSCSSFWASAALAGARPESERLSPLFSFFLIGEAGAFEGALGELLSGAFFATGGTDFETFVAVLTGLFETGFGEVFLTPDVFEAFETVFLIGETFFTGFFNASGFLTTLGETLLTALVAGFEGVPEDFRDTMGFLFFFNG
jgi:hypothetical protein